MKQIIAILIMVFVSNTYALKSDWTSMSCSVGGFTSGLIKKFLDHKAPYARIRVNLNRQRDVVELEVKNDNNGAFLKAYRGFRLSEDGKYQTFAKDGMSLKVGLIIPNSMVTTLQVLEDDKIVADYKCVPNYN